MDSQHAVRQAAFGEQLAAQGEAFSTSKATFEEQSRASLDRANALHAESVSEMKSYVTAEQAKLSALEERYRRIKEIEEPANYWRKRAERHGLMAGAWAIAAGVFILCVGVAILRSDFPQVDKDTTAVAFFALYSRYLLQSVVGIWVLRLLLRMTLNNVHLMWDAQERVTLISTYLAMNENKAVSEDQKKVMIQAIFRRSKLSEVDDGAPIGVIERLGK